MNPVGLQLALRATLAGTWRVYEVLESERFGAYAKVLRTPSGGIQDFETEEEARSFIEAMPDAVEVDHPEGARAGR